jgi:hypothetical protein
MDPPMITALAALILLELLKNKVNRNVWVESVLSNRLTSGIFHSMFSAHRDNPHKFFSYYRMSVNSFDELLSIIRQRIKKQDTNMRKSITPAERLAVTLK